MIKIRYNSYKGHPFATFVSKLINILSYFLILFSLCFFVISLDTHPIDISGAIICALVFVFTIIVLLNHDKVIAFLFFRPKQPAYQADETTDGSNAGKSTTEPALKPKKPIFERYDTYITCPGCGALVRKGTNRCECGYDLSSPISRIGRRLRRAIPVFLCIVLIVASAVAGFFFGQKKMESQLQKSYDSGYNDGAAVGYSNGYKNGLHDGLTDAAKAQSKTDMPILSDSSIAMPRLYSK